MPYAYKPYKHYHNWWYHMFPGLCSICRSDG